MDNLVCLTDLLLDCLNHAQGWILKSLEESGKQKYCSLDPTPTDLDLIVLMGNL